MGHSQITRPQKVGIAVKLLYITLGIGVLSSIMQLPMMAQMAPPAYTTFFTVFTFWIMWFLFFMIGKGRNWARITYLVWFILGALFLVSTLLTLKVNPILGLLGLGSMVIQVVALVLLFQKPSSEWFKEMKANKQHKLQQPEKG